MVRTITVVVALRKIVCCDISSAPKYHNEKISGGLKIVNGSGIKKLRINWR